MSASHTLTSRWDTLFQCLGNFIIDLIDGSCEVPCQVRTNYTFEIYGLSIMQADGVIRLEELTRLCWVYVHHVRRYIPLWFVGVSTGHHPEPS